MKWSTSRDLLLSFRNRKPHIEWTHGRFTTFPDQGFATFLNPRLGSHLQLWRGEVGQHNRGRIQLNSFVTPHKEQSEKRKEVEKKDEAWTA